jgi:hypothetical protein
MQQAGGKPRRSNATDRKNAPLQKINWCSGLNGVKSRKRSCVAILRALWIQGVHGMEVNAAGKVPLRLTVEEAPDAPEAPRSPVRRRDTWSIHVVRVALQLCRSGGHLRHRSELSVRGSKSLRLTG